MEKTTTTPRPVCAQESLALLNCVAAVPFDRDRCLALVDALRDCIAQKKVKKFSLAEPSSSSSTSTEAPKRFKALKKYEGRTFSCARYDYKCYSSVRSINHFVEPSM